MHYIIEFCGPIPRNFVQIYQFSGCNFLQLSSKYSSISSVSSSRIYLSYCFTPLSFFFGKSKLYFVSWCFHLSDSFRNNYHSSRIHMMFPNDLDFFYISTFLQFQAVIYRKVLLIVSQIIVLLLSELYLQGNITGEPSYSLSQICCWFLFNSWGSV